MCVCRPVCVRKKDGRLCVCVCVFESMFVCVERLLCILVQVCVQKNIYTCAYTSYEVSQDFYVGH